mmetsp:Transcript_72590/g.144188  ORF Transcript_72590/g.144188 Transcript_72590/m.144188 type:complete len:215 (+) Transcript_72590:851-1495(+)
MQQSPRKGSRCRTRSQPLGQMVGEISRCQRLAAATAIRFLSRWLFIGARSAPACSTDQRPCRAVLATRSRFLKLQRRVRNARLLLRLPPSLMANFLDPTWMMTRSRQVTPPLPPATTMRTRLRRSQQLLQRLNAGDGRAIHRIGLASGILISALHECEQSRAPRNPLLAISRSRVLRLLEALQHVLGKQAVFVVTLQSAPTIHCPGLPLTQQGA